MKERILNIQEEAQEKIKSLQKVEPDFIMSWLGGLTDLEQKIVAILYQLNNAVTIKEIFDRLIENTYYKIMNISYNNFPFKSYFEIEESQGIIFKLRESYESSPGISSQLKKLKELHMFPSFRRIDNNIRDLITLGIVLKREGKLENEKIKGLYYLNPIIRTQLNKLKK